MTMTYGADAPTEHYDQGAPDSLGSGSGAPRRRRTGTPNYPASSVFARPEIRGLVADIIAAKVGELSDSTEFGTAFLINQLDEVLNELRGQE